MYNELLNKVNFIEPVNEISSVQSIVVHAANVAALIALALSFVTLTYALILFATTKGEAKAVARAYEALFWSLFGIVVSFLLYMLRGVVARLVNTPDMF